MLAEAARLSPLLFTGRCACSASVMQMIMGRHRPYAIHPDELRTGPLPRAGSLPVSMPGAVRMRKGSIKFVLLSDVS